jgi:hypothetical protein
MREAFAANLLGTMAFAHRMDELNARRVDAPDSMGCSMSIVGLSETHTMGY